MIGVLLATNRFDGFSRDYLQAAYLAQKEYNDQLNPPGGLLVRLLLAKSGSDPKQSAEIAYQIVKAARADPTIVGVMGWPTSETSQDTLPILAPAHIPLVAPGAVSDQLTGTSSYFFRIGPPNKITVPLLARYVETRLKPQHVVVFEDPPESYSQNLAEDFIHQYSADGYGNHLARTQTFTTGGPSAVLMRSVQKALQQYTPDVIVFTSSNLNDMTTVLSTIPNTAQVKVVMGTAGYEVTESDKTFTGYDRLCFSSGASPDEWLYFNEAKPPFFQDYQNTFDPNGEHINNPYSYRRPTSVVMLGYDAMLALFDGSQKALQAGKNLKITPDDLRLALTKIRGSQALQGITGQISFDSNGDPTKKVNFVLCVDQNKDLHIDASQGCFYVNCNPR